jgi:hypothetical protein
MASSIVSVKTGRPPLGGMSEVSKWKKKKKKKKNGE